MASTNLNLYKFKKIFLDLLKFDSAKKKTSFNMISKLKKNIEDLKNEMIFLKNKITNLETECEYHKNCELKNKEKFELLIELNKEYERYFLDGFRLSTKFKHQY